MNESNNSVEKLPSLNADRSFWGMAVTQFLGAFNDNLFKQLMLLLATPTAVAIAAGKASKDLQGEAMIVFAGAFLLFSGLAGYVADKLSKRFVIVYSKAAEIVVMLLGFAGFYFYDIIGFSGMLVVLFLMGMQSAFFGPSKYGILPEMLRIEDLPRANGIFLMLTFLAIIFGTAAAGLLLEKLGSQVWLASLICVAIAVVGTLTALIVRNTPVADPSLRFRWTMVGIPREMRALLRQDRNLLLALVVSSLFWMIGGIVQQTVNALGKTQLGLSDGPTSVMAASIGLGIAMGCVTGGYLSRGYINPRVVKVGAIGICVTLVIMALPGGEHGHLLGYPGSVPVLIVLGTFTGIFIVPIQVALQSLPPKQEKGRMIALMNQCSWIGIIVGAILYKVCILVLDTTGGSRSLIFLVTALIMLPVTLFYRPRGETVESLNP
jgi:MFS family permease